jgi:hypothetical protein
MRWVVIIPMIFLSLVVPAQADVDSGVALSITEIQIFVVNNVGPLTFTYSSYSDYGTPQDIGDINYDLQANSAWEVEARIYDSTAGGQNADDWDDGSWTLSVNGVAINESSGMVIDSGGGPVARDDALWEVLLTIPWPESTSNPDCRIQLTATSL